VGHKIKHKPKVKKEEIIQQPEAAEEEFEYNDQFVEIANKALDTSIRYKYIVFALIFISIAVAATLAFIDSNKKKKVATVSQEFSKALSVYNAEVVPNSEAEGQFKTTKQKYNKAIEEFTAFISAHPKTELANISKMYIANAYYNMNDYDNALKYYDNFLNSNDENDLKELVSLKKAQIYKDAKKNKDKAVELFKKLKDSENEYIASISLYSLFQINKDKNKDEAKKYADELAKKFPDSYYNSKLKLDNKL